MEDLESSVIRHLILKAKLTGSGMGNNFQISTIVRAVCDLAVGSGLLREVPRLEYQHPMADKITAVIWELIIEGVYTPGIGMQAPNLPHLRITEHGRRCLEAGELTPHDPDDYLRRLKAGCPSIDAITLLYLGEALQTFRAGNHLATAVMVGVAAEKTLFRLVDEIHNALDTPAKQHKFKQETGGRVAKRQHDEVLKRLKFSATPLPAKLDSVLTQHLDAIYDLIRRSRNDAGHPTGKKMERQETYGLLLLFPIYCKTAHDLMDWLATNKI